MRIYYFIDVSKTAHLDKAVNMVLKINKAFKYRMYPTQTQKELLEKHFGACRWVYNYGLNLKIKHYKETGDVLNKYNLQSKLPELKKTHPWLKEINAQSLQSSLLHLDIAFTNFFKRKAKEPVFKSKYDNYKSFTLPQRFSIEGNKFKCPKFREGIKIVYHREMEGKKCFATISKTCTDKYYVSIVCELEIEVDKKSVEKETALGIDLGLKDFAVTSGGEKFERHKFVKPKRKQLKKAQRSLFKKVKGSANRNKQRKRVAIIHEKIANKRNDLSHKVSRQLVEKNQIYTYCLEDLNVKGMMKNHKLAESIADVAWSEFVRQLTYKSEWVGKNIKEIGRFEASSKTCSKCGTIKKNLTLKDRKWSCENCGAKHDRDVNAAINIRDFAFYPHTTTNTAGAAEIYDCGDTNFVSVKQ